MHFPHNVLFVVIRRRKPEMAIASAATINSYSTRHSEELCYSASAHTYQKSGKRRPTPMVTAPAVLTGSTVKQRCYCTVSDRHRNESKPSGRNLSTVRA